MEASRLAPVAVLLTAFALVVATCSDPEDPVVATTLPPVVGTTTATTAPPVTTTAVLPMTTTSEVVAGPMTEQEAYAAVFAFDPVEGDPTVLAEALAVTGPRPAFALPRFLEVGSPGVRSVVFDSLSDGSPWSVTMLVAMQEYGMPSGTTDDPKLWSSALRLEIADALRTSADDAYGHLAEIMIDMSRHLVVAENEACAASGCDRSGDWYIPPSTLADPMGQVTDAMLFQGRVVLASESGAGDVVPVTVQRFDTWQPVAGFLSDPPAFGLDESAFFDGMVVTDPTIDLHGWAEAGARLSVGGSEVTVEGTWWAIGTVVPDDGQITIVGTAAGGATHEETLRLTYLDESERRLGFITGFGDVDGVTMLAVDYAEWLIGAAATAAAREDGVIGPEDEIENDFYIRNNNPRLRTLPLAPDANVRLIDVTRGQLIAATVTTADFVAILASGDDHSWYGAASEWTPFWFVLGPDGFVRQVEQQYVP